MARGGRADAHKTTRVAAITPAGLQALETPEEITEKQHDALALLAGTPTGIATPVLAGRGIAADAISRLVRRGYISIRRDRLDRDPFAGSDWRQTGVRPPTDRGEGTSRGQSGVGPLSDSTRRLTAEQAAALDRLTVLAATREFRVALLHGVTGSGKTEIYIRLSAAVRAAGRRVLVLVPEIALTPAAASLFRDAFRRSRRHPAQRPVGRRTPRSVAAHPPGRRRHRRRHAIGGFRAARRGRPDRRR